MIVVASIAAVALLAIAGVAVFAIWRVTGLAEAQAARDADANHVMADRLQHPQIARPFRTPPPPVAPVDSPLGFELAGRDVSDLSDQEFLKTFGDPE